MLPNFLEINRIFKLSTAENEPAKIKEEWNNQSALLDYNSAKIPLDKFINKASIDLPTFSSMITCEDEPQILTESRDLKLKESFDSILQSTKN